MTHQLSTFEQSVAYQAIDAAKEKYDEIAKHMGTNLNAETEIIFVKQWLRDQGEGIWSQIDPNSLYYAVLQAARIGISLCPFQKHAILLTRTNFNGYYCEHMLTYHGYISLACDSGIVKQISSAEVYSEDEFQKNGEFALPTHTTKRLRTEGNLRGDLEGAYAAAIYDDGSVLVDYIYAEELKEIEENAKLAFENTVWDTSFIGQMRRKSAIRRLMRLLLPQLKNYATDSRYIERLNAAVSADDEMQARLNNEMTINALQMKQRQNVLAQTAPEQLENPSVVSLSSPSAPAKVNNIQSDSVKNVNFDLMEKLTTKEVEKPTFTAPTQERAMGTGGFGQW